MYFYRRITFGSVDYTGAYLIVISFKYVSYAHQYWYILHSRVV